MLVISIFACRPQTPVPIETHPIDTGAPISSRPPLTVPSSSTFTPPTYDCDALPESATFTALGIKTNEDFDFDEKGQLLYESHQSILGRTFDGHSKVIAVGLGDVAGIQVAAPDQIIYAEPYTGEIWQVDATVGSHTLVMGGLATPDGLELAGDGVIYYSERDKTGRVGWVDPNTGTNGVITNELNHPNGLALSPDSLTLYIAGGYENDTVNGIIAVDAIGDGTWSAPRAVLTAGDADYDGVEVDVCGNVYGIAWGTTKLYRVRPDGSDPVVLVDFASDVTEFAGFNAMRWGGGWGGWRRDVLYVTDRDVIFAVEAGVPGKPSPVSNLYDP